MNCLFRRSSFIILGEHHLSTVTTYRTRYLHHMLVLCLYHRWIHAASTDSALKTFYEMTDPRVSPGPPWRQVITMNRSMGDWLHMIFIVNCKYNRKGWRGRHHEDDEWCRSRPVLSACRQRTHSLRLKTYITHGPWQVVSRRKNSWRHCCRMVNSRT